MKISSKSQYSIYIILEIALADGSLLTTREIAKKQGISLKYTEQIVSVLTKAGFVASQRGAFGGYFLAKEPDNISVSDIFRAVEGKLSVANDNSGDTLSPLEQCISNALWNKLEESVKAITENITIKDLVDAYNDRGNYVYII